MGSGEVKINFNPFLLPVTSRSYAKPVNPEMARPVSVLNMTELLVILNMQSEARVIPLPELLAMLHSEMFPKLADRYTPVAPLLVTLDSSRSICTLLARIPSSPD